MSWLKSLTLTLSQFLVVTILEHKLDHRGVCISEYEGHARRQTIDSIILAKRQQSEVVLLSLSSWWFQNCLQHHNMYHMKVKSLVQEHGQIVESYDNLSHLHHLQVHMFPILAGKWEIAEFKRSEMRD